MEIWFNKTEYDRLYSCDYLNESQWREYATKRPVSGALCLVLAVLYFITYVPCLIVMTRKQFFDNSCFKIMFFNGIVDVIAILINGFITGYLLIVGTIFCLWPTLQYWIGLLAVTFWCGQCFNCTVLAINRCLDFWAPNLSEFVFKGPRTFIWWMMDVAYILYLMIFTKPTVLNSSVYIWWMMDVSPRSTVVPVDRIPVDRSEYFVYALEVNNYVSCFLLFFLYTILIISFRVKGSQLTSQSHEMQLHLLKQAGFICLLNCIPGMLFIAVQFIPSPPEVIYICLITYQMGNGGGGLIFLIVNKTMRQKVREMFFGAKKYPSVVTQIHSCAVR
ncbi:hypothetical protein QR680_011985 [Steinernema hermaphroditum]|uniref:Uncharacterized protein n=1 Tax=Steinernema hermaphroditum TaxID=289476 RepID=A0AA39I2B7_9BILA|nr:hypothetical protein QR680_011985 [Steinernema hermaphroditum]